MKSNSRKRSKQKNDAAAAAPAGRVDLKVQIRAAQGALNAEFRGTRKAIGDSTVKGHLNEHRVAKFLREHVPSWWIATNVSIIDSQGNASGEVDVVACNAEQPFRSEGSGIAICEGVDFCVQVKARLDPTEMKRIVANCKSVKRLARSLHLGGFTQSPMYQPDPQRVAYFVFAYATRSSPEALMSCIIDGADRPGEDEQPDGIFVLNPGISLINCGNGMRFGLKNGDQLLKNWVEMRTKDATLWEFLRFAHRCRSRLPSSSSALSAYFGSSLPYETRTFSSSDG